MSAVAFVHTHSYVFNTHVNAPDMTAHTLPCFLSSGHMFCAHRTQSRQHMPAISQTHTRTRTHFLWFSSILKDSGLQAVLAQTMCEIALFCKDLP